ELLADQAGADDLAVHLDEAPLRLPGEDHAGDAGHEQGIDQSGDQRQRDHQHDGRSDFLDHGEFSSGKVQGRDREVDGLDADERNDDAAYAVDQQVTAQQRPGADRAVGDALQRQRDQRDDDQRVEDDGRQDGALRARQAHDVERLQLRIERHEHGRDDGEIFRHVVGDGEGGERAARHQELLADLDDLDELG